MRSCLYARVITSMAKGSSSSWPWVYARCTSPRPARRCGSPPLRRRRTASPRVWSGLEGRPWRRSPGSRASGRCPDPARLGICWSSSTGTVSAGSTRSRYCGFIVSCRNVSCFGVCVKDHTVFEHNIGLLMNQEPMRLSRATLVYSIVEQTEQGAR